MKIHSGEIHNYKSIKHVEFQIHGNHMIIKGVNGVGKSAVLETLNIIFAGKKGIPEKPIRNGEESAKFTWNMGNNEKIVYTFEAEITESKYTLKFYQYINGKKIKLSNATSFIKSLIVDNALDPQSFYSKDDKDQVRLLYDILPGLKDSLDKIDTDYKKIQQERSFVNRDGKILKVDLEKLKFEKGLPEKEIEIKKLLFEKEKAVQHNNKLSRLKENIEENDGFINLANEKIVNNKKEKDRILSDIARLKKRLQEYNEDLKSFEEEKKIFISKKEETQKKIDEFKEEPIKEIQERINYAENTNKKIRDNKIYKEKENELKLKREEFSNLLKQMKALDQKRVEVFEKVNMPIKGLEVNGGILIFPDPKTGEKVPLKSLSTGQQWSVIIPILSAFLPNEENGIRSMIIKNLNDLDKTNMELMLKEADKAGIQLIMHQTVFEDDDQLKVEII